MNETVYNKLIEIAKKRSFITYQKLSDVCRLGLDMTEINHRNDIAKIIGDISIYEVRNKRPMLSDVVFREDKNQPGNGFFELAFDLNKYNGSKSKAQKDDFFISVLNDVYEYWKNH